MAATFATTDLFGRGLVPAANVPRFVPLIGVLGFARAVA